jgi:hypothetical protein
MTSPNIIYLQLINEIVRRVDLFGEKEEIASFFSSQKMPNEASHHMIHQKRFNFFDSQKMPEEKI